jgi:hypothetical protein
MRIIVCLILFLAMQKISEAGGIRGRVTMKNGEALPYAGIAVKGTSNGTMANEEGQYEFTLPAGTHEIIFQYLGSKVFPKLLQLVPVLPNLTSSWKSRL